MNKKDINKVTRCAYRHGKILLRGLIRTLYGALTAGLAGVAVTTFAAIPMEGGYIAVCDFIAAVATMMVALCCIYDSGRLSRRKKVH